MKPGLKITLIAGTAIVGLYSFSQIFKAPESSSDQKQVGWQFVIPEAVSGDSPATLPGAVPDLDSSLRKLARSDASSLFHKSTDQVPADQNKASNSSESLPALADHGHDVASNLPEPIQTRSGQQPPIMASTPAALTDNNPIYGRGPMVDGVPGEMPPARQPSLTLTSDFEARQPLSDLPQSVLSRQDDGNAVAKQRYVTSRSSSERLSPLSASPVVEQRANEHVTYGKSLARRGSTFAARQEFIQALRLIADSHDMNSGTREYTNRLATGLRALRESDDFVAADAEQQLNMDLRSIMETHTTRLVSSSDAMQITPIQAMRVYYDFAVYQLDQAVGQSPVASDALSSLGKLLTTSASHSAGGQSTDQAKAIVMHQVAIAANSGNHKSANELGVLMARNGRWQQAHDLFKQSLKVQTSPEAWKNLGKTHQQLARFSRDQKSQQQQNELASLAFGEYELMVQDGAVTGTTIPMGWVSPEEFSRNAAVPETRGEASAMTARATGPGESDRKSKGLLRSVRDWF